MESNGNNSVIIVSELFEALKSRCLGKIMFNDRFMKDGKILMITKYGKVEVTTDYVIYPGNECRYYRESRNVDEYCSFIFDNLDSLSMPLWKVEEVFNEIPGNELKIIHSKENKIRGFLRVVTPYGNLYFNGNHVKFPGNDKIYSRKKRSLRTFCTFIINGISKYSRENSGEKLDEILSGKYDLNIVCIKKPVMEINERKFVPIGGEWHINTRYGKVVTDGNSVKFPGNPNDYYRKKSIEEFAGFIADNIDKFSDIYRNVITETADDDKIGKEFDRIHSEWSAFLDYKKAKANSEYIKTLCDSFAKIVIKQAKEYAKIFDVEIKELHINKVRRGALGMCYYQDNRIEISIDCIALPTYCIRETMLHEICHLFCHGHDLSFYLKLEDMCHTVGLIRNTGYVVPELFLIKSCPYYNITSNINIDSGKLQITRVLTPSCSYGK